MRAATCVLVAGLAFLSVGTRADDPPQEWMFAGQTQTPTADLRARVTGELTRLAVKEGDKVAKGDLLAEIDARPYQLDVDAAKARLMLAEAQLETAKINSANTKALSEQQVAGRSVVSALEVKLKRAAEAEAEARLMIAKVDVQRAELTLSWTRIIAPFEGRVSRIPSKEGTVVTAGQTQILRIVATDAMSVTFNVPESILLRMRRDGLSEPDKLAVAVGFSGEEGTPHEATLDLIAPEVNPQTGSTMFRATLPNPKGLLSAGMSPRVHLAAAP